MLLTVSLSLSLFPPPGAPCYSKPPSLLGPYPRNPPFDYPWGFNPYLPGAFSLNNCPKLPPGSLYPSHFYPNPLQTSLSQLPHPFSSLLPPGDTGEAADRGGAQSGGTNGAAGGQPPRVCIPPYPGSPALGRTELGNGGITSGERDRGEPTVLGPGGPLGLGLGLGGISLGGVMGGRQSPSERRVGVGGSVGGGVKQDPESDSDLEITDLSDCSSDNETDFGLTKSPRLDVRSQGLDLKAGGVASALPPLSSLPPPASPHPLKSLVPLTPPPPSLPPTLAPSLPPSLSPSLTLVDRHRETETLKLAHS